MKWSGLDLNKGIIHGRWQILRQNREVVKVSMETKNFYHHIVSFMQKQMANAVRNFFSSALR